MLSGRQDLARAAAPILSTDEVFVTNGSPSVTYVIRDDQIEAEIAARLGAKQKIMAISGPSKSGKSVLVRRVVVDTLGWQMVEVSGNDLSSIDDFWLTVGAQIGVISAADTTTQAGVEFGAEAGAEVGIPVAGKLKGTVKSNFSQADSTRLQATVDLRQAVRERLAGIDACVVIDDFHYAPEPVQKQLARGIKDLSARRIPVVLIAVSHRVLDLVQAEGELLGRVMRKQVAYWSPIELMRIAAQGFQALNVRDAGGEIAGRLVEQSFGSPLLMQELCGEICTRSSVLRTQDVERELVRPGTWSDFFSDVADSLVHPLAVELRSGPQERRRRKARRLKYLDVDVDTYGAVLLGLRDCLPNTSPTLTELTDAAGGRLEERVKLSEVRRVSKEMNKKAEAVRRGGDPAIDFVASTPERVTIVDPYLAFIIAWGMSTFGLPTLH